MRNAAAAVNAIAPRRKFFADIIFMISSSRQSFESNDRFPRDQ